MSGRVRGELHGRQHELLALDALVTNVAAGSSAAIVVRGEAGIGKTALLGYLATQAEPAFRLAQIAGVESEMEIAYAGLHQLCLPMLDRLAALPAPQRNSLNVAFGIETGSAPDRLLVGLATLGLLAEVASERPLMCLIDDGQWLDEASCAVLGFVARRLDAEAVAMVFALREADGSGPGRLPGLPEMSLHGISKQDAYKLLATVVPVRLHERVRDRLVAETRGNPLALLELPRGMTPAELAAGFGLPSAGSVAEHMEDHFLQRVLRLPESTQQLMLIAAIDPVGDASTIWRAAKALDLGADAAAPSTIEHLFEIGADVRFQHPLVRSAVYRSASPADRRATHDALADAIDRAKEPDRHFWHRAQATVGPDAELADELEASAERAQARGGLAAGAALLEQSARLTPQLTTRVERTVFAAQCNLRAGAFDAALRLLDVADASTADDLVHARIEGLRGQVASASNGGREAPVRLLNAAKRLEVLDPALAHRTHADAWNAALNAAHLADPGGDLVSVSHAYLAAPLPQVPRRPFGRTMDGLVVLATEGRSAAEPLLNKALLELMAADLPADNWLRSGALAQTAAVAVWDFDAWAAVSEHVVDLARELGALAALPPALNGLALLSTWRGDCEAAAAFAAEHDTITQATGTRTTPYGAMVLGAYQGRVEETSVLIVGVTDDAKERGDGLGVDLARWASAILNNGIGRYAEALTTATPSSDDTPALLVPIWMLPERVEAATRCGQTDVAEAALKQFERDANPGTNDWGSGIHARLQAMVAGGKEAEDLYRLSIERLGRTPVRAELARSQLVFGEWLRRESRRIDAREQLRAAYDIFAAMSADGFARRTRRELLATGEHVRSRTDDHREDLTPQQHDIARLARDGQTNAEIAAALYLSVRTVEWHLRNTFIKLGITSRRELQDALPGPGRDGRRA